MQFVGPAGEDRKLVGRLCAAGRFAEHPLPERQRLIGANDVTAGTSTI